LAKNCDFNRFFSVFYKFLRENTKFDKKSLCFQVFFPCFLFKRRISPVSSHFQQITWAIFSRPLHGVMSGARIRQKFAKKRSLHGVNEHFRKFLTRLSCRVVTVQKSPVVGLRLNRLLKNVIEAVDARQKQVAQAKASGCD